MTQQINVLTFSGTMSGMAFEDGLLGLGGQSFRVNAGGTGFEYYTPSAGAIVAVNATSPLTASGTTTRTLAISGLTTLGTAGQVVVTNGTAWQYQDSSGFGNIVRDHEPSIDNLVASGSAFNVNATQGIRVTSTDQASFFLDRGTSGVSSAAIYFQRGHTTLFTLGENIGGIGPTNFGLYSAVSDSLAFSIDGTTLAAHFGGALQVDFGARIVGLSGTAFRIVQASANGTLSEIPLGGALQSIRLNSTASAWEYYTPGSSGVTAVNATTPLIATGTTTRTLSLAGLTTVGTNGQVPVSDGTVWQYVSSTGSSTFVRSASPSLTGTLSMSSTPLIVGNGLGILSGSTSGSLFITGGSSTASSGATITLSGRDSSNEKAAYSLSNTWTSTRPAHVFYAGANGSSEAMRITSTGSSGSISGNTVAISSLAGTAFRMVQASSAGVLSALSIGTAGQALRVNSGATGWEYYTPTAGTITAVLATSPLSASGTASRTLSLAGLTTVGTNGQVPMSDGTVWGYVSSSGSGSFVRTTGATLSGATLTAPSIVEGTITGSVFSINPSTLSYFGVDAVTRRSVSQYFSTAWPNPVLDTEAFNVAVSEFLNNYVDFTRAFGGTGYGMINN